MSASCVYQLINWQSKWLWFDSCRDLRGKSRSWGSWRSLSLETLSYSIFHFSNAVERGHSHRMSTKMGK